MSSLSPTTTKQLIKQLRSHDSDSTSSPSPTQVLLTPSLNHVDHSLLEMMIHSTETSPHESCRGSPLHSPTHVLHSPTTSTKQQTSLQLLQDHHHHGGGGGRRRLCRPSSTNITPPNSRSPTQDTTYSQLPGVHGMHSNTPKQSKSHSGLTIFDETVGSSSSKHQVGGKAESASDSSNPIHKSAPSLVCRKGTVIGVTKMVRSSDGVVGVLHPIIDGGSAGEVGGETDNLLEHLTEIQNSNYDISVADAGRR